MIVESGSRDSTTDEYIASVCAKRGYDGYQFWSQSVKGGYTSMRASSYGDLDGDDKDDVMIVESGSRDSATDEETARVYIKRGYDGHQLWSQSITGEDVDMWVYSYCDLDDDGKNDVIVYSRSYDSTTDEETYRVYAKRGYDGDLFWSQNVTGEDVHMWVYSYWELDGDGKNDVIVNSRSYDSTTDEETASVCAKRGYDGYQFWSRSVTGDGRYGADMWAYPYCDLDGDDKGDVIVESRSCDSTTDEETYSVYAKRGYDGDLFWSQSVTGEDIWMEIEYYNRHYYSSHDFDGDSLEDVLITTGISSGYNEIPTKVCAVKGNDGTALWCKPSAPPATGDLNGDGKLTPADAVIALNIAVSGDYNEYADVNDDGAVNALDVLMILQAAASSITI